MKTFYQIVAWLVVLTGIVHTTMTSVFYPALSLDALWFAGTGLCFVFLGLLNYTALKSGYRSLIVPGICANIIGTIYSLLITYKLSAPQAYLALVLLLALSLASVAVWRQSGK